MASEIKLPQLGQTMEEATIISRLVKVGDQIKKGDVIFEIETDKATLEMESPVEGFVKHVVAQEGQTLKVGELMMIVGAKDEEVAAPAVAPEGAAPPAAAEPIAEAAPPETAPSEAAAEPAKPTDRVTASARAKKLAREKGVDLAEVEGTGPGGRIVEKDVLAAAAVRPGAGPAEAVPEAGYKLGQTIPLSRLQKITGERMLKSKQEIPCFYLMVKADVTDLVAHRTQMNQSGEVKVAYNDFIMRAVAMGLEKFPIMAGQVEGDSIKLAESIGVGLAIAVPGGLAAPVVQDVNKKSVTQIARDSQALIERAKNNKLRPDDLGGGCITVSNLGALGIESFIPIVVPGQCSILGIGQITDTLVPDRDTPQVRKLMSMTLSVDHKVTNGAYAGQFLDFVRKLLEDPSNFQ